MPRIIAGASAAFLLLIGGFLLWQGRAQKLSLPSAPQPRLMAVQPQSLPPIGDAPAANPKSKEEKRFARADKDESGQISLAELVEPRRKAYAKLDLDQDGKLSFEEWAVKTIGKFETADADRNKLLSPAEYAATAPKRRPKPACSC